MRGTAEVYCHSQLLDVLADRINRHENAAQVKDRARCLKRHEFRLEWRDDHDRRLGVSKHVTRHGSDNDLAQSTMAAGTHYHKVCLVAACGEKNRLSRITVRDFEVHAG